MNDDDFDDLFGQSDLVTPQWKVEGGDNNLRQTEFVPTYNDEEEVAMKVYTNNEFTPHKESHMKTIKEEEKSTGSDTAYFVNDDEDLFNERDDVYFEENEEEKYQQQLEEIEKGIGFQEDDIAYDDEDNQPFDEEDYFDSDEEKKRVQEEFGEEDEEEEEDQVDQMSLTMMDRQKKGFEKEMIGLKRRQMELRQMITRKKEEGIGLAGEELFNEVLEIFNSMAAVNNSCKTVLER